jgi:hypothetical protein
VNTFLFGTSKLEVKIYKARSAAAINQLANNLEVQDREMFWNHIFDQTVGNPRAITELINRYRKEPFGHANNQEIRHSGALPEIDMTWIVIVSSVCSLRCAFVARNGRTRLAVHRLNGYDFAVFCPPDDGELQEKFV